MQQFVLRPCKEDAAATITQLRALGVKRLMVMLTSDSENVAAEVFSKSLSVTIMWHRFSQRIIFEGMLSSSRGAYRCNGRRWY